MQRVKQNLRNQSPDYLLKIPLAKYKRWYCIPACSYHFDAPVISRSSWVEVEPTSDVLSSPATAVFNRFDDMTPEELWKFYRVHTKEEFFALSSEEREERLNSAMEE